MKISHQLHQFKISSEFSLEQFMKEDVTDITFKNSPFVLVEWRQFEGTALVYKSGAVLVHGNNIDKYYTHLLQLSYTLSPVKLITKSGVYKLKGRVNYSTLVYKLNCTYEPGIFHAATKYIDKLHFIIYHTGTVVVTGLTSQQTIDTALGFLLELELLL